MSQPKSVGSKRKALIPNEISVSLKTPRSRKVLLSNASVASNPRESEIEDGTPQIKRSKIKKLRRTQNFLDFVDETDSEVRTRVSDSLKRKKKTLSAESINTESSEVFPDVEERQKSTTKSRKKKMKLPAVVIDDLECLDDNVFCEKKNSPKRKKSRKQRSIDSNNPSLEAMNAENSERKVKRKKGSRKSNEGETITVKTRSSRKQNKRSEITDSQFNAEESEANTENNEVDEEVTIMNNHFSSVDEDEINGQSSRRKTKRKKKSKRSNQKHEVTVPTVLKTRSSRKEHNNKEIYDENEGESSRKSSQTTDSEFTDQTGANIENYEVDYQTVLTNKGFSSVDEDDEMNAQTYRRKKKRSKNSDQTHDGVETVITKTRSSRKQQKDKEINVESEENLKTDKELNNQIGDSEVKEDAVFTKKHYSSIDEDDEKDGQTSRRKRKRSKKSDQKQDEDETITPKTRSLRGQRDKEINVENKENIIPYNEIRNSGKKEVNKDENILYHADEDIIFSKKYYSSIDENDEIDAQSSRRKRKRSKKTDQEPDEDEKVTTKTRGLKGQKNKDINDGSEEILRTNEDVILTKKHYSSVDEDDEMVAQTTRRKRIRSKKSDQKHDEDQTITSKNRSLRGEKDKETNSESAENIITDNELNNESEDSGEKVVNEGEDILSHVDGDDEMAAQTTRRKKKLSKKSDKKHDEDRTITPKKRSLRRQKDKEINAESEENIIIDNELNNEIEDSGENVVNEVEDSISNKKFYSSMDGDDEMEVQTSSKKRKRSKKKDQTDEDETITTKTRNSKEEKDGISTNKSEETIEINEGDIFTSEHSSSLGEDDDSAGSKNVYRKSSRILNYGSTDKSGTFEGNTDDSEVPEEVIFTSNPSSSADDDDIILETSGRKRKRSMISFEKGKKVPKISISRSSLGNNDLGKILKIGNDNKENIKTSNESKVENSSISRRSCRISNSLLTDKTGEAEGNDEVKRDKNLTNTRFSLVDRDDELVIDSNGVTSHNHGRKASSGRKRWTIMGDKKELIPSFEINERPNVSLNVSTNPRRSVRKRWSTELRKNFESMKEENEPLVVPVGVSRENSFSDKRRNENGSSTSTLNTSVESPVSTRNIHFSSPIPINVSAFNSPVEKQNDTYTPDKSGNVSSFRRSKRLSRSLDLSEGILPLEETITLENESAEFHNDDPESSFNRKSLRPCSILKRRGTYDLDVSVTDVSVLKSLSESNLSDPGLLFKQDDSENVKKNVRFQHVTVRKVCNRKGGPHTPENQIDLDNSQVTTEKKAVPKLASAKKSVSFDQTMFSASSLASSTPLHSLRKNALMRQTSRRENLSNVVSNRRSRSVETKRDKYVSRIRMPNFTKIHQRAMDRVEDIAEMAKRKAERARLLLSGQKPTANANSTNKSQEKTTSHLKQPKQLRFARCQPSSSHPADEGTSNSIMNKVPKEAGQIRNDSSRSKIGANKNTQANKQIEAASSKHLLAKSGIPDKLRKVKANPAPFDSAVKRAEQIKTIATKSKPQTTKDNREERRTILKGVRGNRRFELLMKMRNNK